jgi:glycosyltransferase involved in cell wall biosynthesis
MMNEPISIAIPTYRREQTLLDTLVALLSLERRAQEILVLDQSETHEAATEEKLAELDRTCAIRWLRLETPSIPKAMNRALLEATAPVVLFLDDDIIPDKALVAAHAAAHGRFPGALIAGRVIQPWNEGKDYSRDTHFHFACLKPQRINEFMGGNFSVSAIESKRVGGFDENFVKVAYRFEAEFAHRWISSGGLICYEPDAAIHHLKVSAGGTRTFGEHLTTVKPDHAVGAYYFTLRTQSGVARVREVLRRVFLSVRTRHHLRRPWWIPLTLFAELRGLAWAVALAMRGPSYVRDTRRMEAQP